MTIPFPLGAFDDARPVRAKRPRRRLEHDKLVGIGITLAIHVVILGRRADDGPCCPVPR